MSTVLWTNLLENGVVRTDENDKYALHEFSEALDAMGQQLGLGSFLSICDSIDLRFSIEDDMELPEGMESTVEWMARDGQWMDVAPAIRMLEGLVAHLRTAKPTLGTGDADREQTIEELEEALTFARSAEAGTARFNFSIVM